MSEEKEKNLSKKPSYYITTPIYYVNAAPHLGHAYTSVMADVQSRLRRAMGFDVLFLTGIDEHGEKVAQAAAEHNMSPQAWCDSLVPAFKDLLGLLNIKNDDFIRTTEPRHTKAVQTLWEDLLAKDYLYKDTYDGWYCMPEETYFTETQVHQSDEEKGTEGQHLCPDCGRPLERVEEESWFFKLSAFQEPLLELYEKNPHFIEPEIRRNEVVSFVKGGLKDLSVSRTSFDWGIPLPFDDKHVTYVWFDALINYLTAAGFAGDPKKFSYRWPANAQLIGKDILRFHCVIWPAMLMAAGIEVSDEVFVHGFLLVKDEKTGDETKMSKSRGNAITPQSVVDLLGVDGFRYFFMSDVKPGADGSISWSRMAQVYNTDLANSWGNLVSRTLNMSAKYFDGKVPGPVAGWPDAENPLKGIATDLVDRFNHAAFEFAYDEALAEVFKLIHAANHYIEDMEPWALAKSEATLPKLQTVILNLLEAIRIAAYLLMPFMPETSAEALRRFGQLEERGCGATSGDASVSRSMSDPGATLDEICVWGNLKLEQPVEKGDALFPRLDPKDLEA